jgi:hypothetical protein
MIIITITIIIVTAANAIILSYRVTFSSSGHRKQFKPHLNGRAWTFWVIITFG